MLMQSADGAQETLQALHALGIGVTIDDFDAGHRARSVSPAHHRHLHAAHKYVRNITQSNDDAAVTAPSSTWRMNRTSRLSRKAWKHRISSIYSANRAAMPCKFLLQRGTAGGAARRIDGKPHRVRRRCRPALN